MMAVNRAPNVNDAISQALKKIQSTSSLHHRVLLVECLKKWSRCDDSSINDSSSNDSSTDHDTNPAPAPGVDLGVGDGDAETSQRPDTESVLPSASEDEAGPPRRRRRLDDFYGQCQGQASNSGTLEPFPGSSGFTDNNSLGEDDDDTYPVRGAPLPGWLDVDGEVFEEPLQDPDLTFLD
ncbi:hypothetical protein HPB51_023245 [Rhipicephalus microplus]|uniref:Uncharacterized protein n=1 Tax=Rhipicephalus microplus TaxID=6941 RepID=A0A9J6ED46_RHIMP|nr:hypothetical protein HPB51_023245 [Rhipicephalus microplus]